jgi:2-polyprenyl-6-methoxyphenol hydroxylase-like FAD-dependent oxidoreductase
MIADFVVVGGGIGGAVLAELLGRGRKKVIVLEKSTGPPNFIRPEVLWPATMEMLFSLIPRETWEKEAVLPMRGVEFHDGQRVTPFITPELLQEAQVQPWSTNPNETRELLLHLGSFELRRGVDVIDVIKKRNRIAGVRTRDVATGKEFEVLAECTIGDDGVHSVVRKACGIEIKTRMLRIDLLGFGFDWPSTLPVGMARIWMNLKGLDSGILGLVTIPAGARKGAGLVPVRSKIFNANPNVTESWNRLCSIDTVIHDVIRERRFPQDFVRIRRPWGHAPRYGTEGAILIGDAAHPVSPAGGQGANMSVADACVLAELALRNEPNLLAEYERRRRPANERSMGPTRVAARITGLPEWVSSSTIFLSMVRWVGRHPSLMRRAIRSFSTRFQEKAN